MLLTKLGVSGPLGPGTQVWPWITLTDEVRAIRHIIDAFAKAVGQSAAQSSVQAAA